ncbi:hypothetical protein [Ruminococcus sp.]|uniref:hypothetical protein n=1 Tax=Ruminococcus sp. TaxID=41978 RepID=UPI00388F0E3A
MKKNTIKTRIIAGVLSTITIFSVGAASVAPASAAATEQASTSAGAGSMAENALGFVGKTLLNATGMKLANMAIDPVFNLIFGTNDGPSNQDVIDDVDKQAEEIKAKIDSVLTEVQALSESANHYHNEEMAQLRSIDSNISTMEFRKQTDKIADDYTNVLKRIRQNKDNFTCDGMGKLNNTTYKAYKEIISDPVCSISTLQADFDATLGFLKGDRSSNNHENGYAQLTSYLLDRVIAADKNEHSYRATPDYHKVIKGINNEISSMEEHAILDFFAINVLNNMQKKVKEYEIDHQLITVNDDEAPYTKYENTASELLESLSEMDGIFNKVISDNNAKIYSVAPYTLKITTGNNVTEEKGCRDFIDAWSQGIDSHQDFSIDSNGRLLTVKADAVKGYKLDDHVKGINASGGFEVPSYRKVELNLGTTFTNTGVFDSTAKADLNTFTVNNNSRLTVSYASISGGSHAVLVPDNANDTTVFYNRGVISATRSAAICVSAGASNTDLTVIGDYNYDCAGGLDVQNANTKTWIIFNQIDPPSTEPDWYT